MERGFSLTKPEYFHESHGKHEVRYKPARWAEEADLFICLIKVLAAAMKKKGKP